ncbi:hypothetical protein IAU60_003493 [Kwoniella sp. DSM 27419]
MHIPRALVLLLPLVLAHEPMDLAHRRHHARAVLDARQGIVNDNGTLASGAAGDIIPASTSQAAVSATPTPSSAPSEQVVVTSSTVSSAIDSGVAGGPPSSTVESSAVVSSSAPSTSTTDTMTSTVAVATSTSTSTSVAPSTVASTDLGPSTVTPAASSAMYSGSAGSIRSTIILVTPSRSQTVHTASSTAEAADSQKKTSGLSKAALIAIIVVASVVGLAAIGWTLFRKWKLRPSNRFDKRMNPIDFSPHNDTMDDDFFEKTLQRTASNSSATRQRQELVAELDNPSNVAGVPPHDFTAGAAGVGAGAAAYGAYEADPYAHAEQYDYDQTYQQHPHGHGYDQHAHQYPPLAHGQDAQGYAGYDGAPQDQPLNEGYADLQRGGSIGSGSGHGHGYTHVQQGQGQGHEQTVYPGELTFPNANQYGALGRPTGGAEGPYAQAAQYRGY